MTEIVERVKPLPDWEKDDGSRTPVYDVLLVGETGERWLRSYGPEAGHLVQDAPLPDGWQVRDSKAGKPYLAAPRAGGSKGGGGGRSYTPRFSDTEAGFWAEQKGINARKAIEIADTSGMKLDDIFEWLMTQVPEAYR